VKLNTDAILVRMSELQINRRQLAERAGLNYGVLCESLNKGEASTINIGKMAQGLNTAVDSIVIKSLEVNT